MALVGMINEDEDALICDFAETYHIFDYKRLPVRTAAVLAAGLGQNSRIKRKLSGEKTSSEFMMLAAIFDGIQTLIWMQTEDGRKGKNRPKLILKMLESNQEMETQGFRTSEEYEEARAAILEQHRR